MKIGLAWALLVLSWSPGFAQDLSTHFAGISGTFVLLNGTTGQFIRHDPERAAQRFAPCSTFKIPHTAILLETGTAPDPEFLVLKQLAYGNESASGGLEGSNGPFWVDGTLRGSADEQVDFLRRFHDGRLGLSERTTTLTKDIMVADSMPRWRLSAKTGACRPPGEDATMWYVGYVEKDSNVFYFALQLGDKEYGSLFEQRVSKAKAILAELGILD